MFEEFGVSSRNELIEKVRIEALRRFPGCHVYVSPVYSDVDYFETASVIMKLSSANIKACQDFLASLFDDYKPEDYEDTESGVPLLVHPYHPYNEVDITEGLKLDQMYIDCGPNQCVLED